MATWATGRKLHKLREAILARDGYVCRWCGCKTFRVPPNTRRLHQFHATIDHVVPRSRGGTNDVDNLVMSCFGCNQRRGNGSGSAGPISERELVRLMSV
jgi:5-methylcytosine-specific restriction endonuclease McrA